MTRSSPQIRRYEMRDLKGVRRLEAISFPFPLSKLALVFLSEVCIFYVVTIDEEVVGYIILGYEDKEILHCFRIAVAPTQKRRRIASRLLRKAVLDNPTQRFTTEVRMDNIEGVRFWESQGFKEVSRDHIESDSQKGHLVLARDVKGS